MSQFEQHIKRATEPTRLTEAEKTRMRSVLLQYMAHKPIRASSGNVASAQLSYTWISIIHRPVAAALVLVLVFGSGISYAAENALPGDILYSVKTLVNEPVRVALATDAEAKAEIQIELAERRIEEAATLAANNRLDAATQEQLAIAFESHADAAATRMEEIEKEDSPAATELSSSFETRLAAHESVLASVQHEQDSDSRLSRAIRSRGLAVADIRTRAEQKVAVSTDRAANTALMSISMKMATPENMPATGTDAVTDDRRTSTTAQAESGVDTKAAKRMQGAAEKKLKALKKQKRDAIAKLSNDERAEVEAEIEQAEVLLAEGKDHTDGENAALAYHSFQQSLIISERLDVFLKASPSLAKARSRSAVNVGSDPTNAAATATMEAATTRERVRTTTAPKRSEEAFTTELEATTSGKIIPPSTRIFVPIHDDDLEDEDDHESDTPIIEIDSKTRIDLNL